MAGDLLDRRLLVGGVDERRGDRHAHLQYGGDVGAHGGVDLVDRGVELFEQRTDVVTTTPIPANRKTRRYPSPVSSLVAVAHLSYGHTPAVHG